MNWKGIITIVAIIGIISVVALMQGKSTELLPTIGDNIEVTDRSSMSLEKTAEDQPKLVDSVSIENQTDLTLTKKEKQHYVIEAIDKPTIKP